MNHALFVTTLGSALGCGICAGVFFAFSTFVMPALSRIAPAEGVSAMQAINVAAINRWFMGAMFGTAGACLLLALGSLFFLPEPRAGLWLGGALLYLGGNIGVTMACNVPLNNALAAASPEQADATGLWRHYLDRWCFWNHVRAATGVAASALLILALLGRG